MTTAFSKTIPLILSIAIFTILVFICFYFLGSTTIVQPGWHTSIYNGLSIMEGLLLMASLLCLSFSAMKLVFHKLDWIPISLFNRINWLLALMGALTIVICLKDIFITFYSGLLAEATAFYFRPYGNWTFPIVGFYILALLTTQLLWKPKFRENPVPVFFISLAVVLSIVVIKVFYTPVF